MIDGLEINQSSTVNTNLKLWQLWSLASVHKVFYDNGPSVLSAWAVSESLLEGTEIIVWLCVNSVWKSGFANPTSTHGERFEMKQVCTEGAYS